VASETSYDFQFDDFFNYLIHPGAPILHGLVITVVIAAISQILGIVVGVVAATMRRSHIFPLRQIANFYIWLMRGTPFLLQVSIVYFAGFPFLGLAIFGGYRWGNVEIFGIVILGSILAGIFALTFNEGAYMAVIIEAGIDSVDVGQMEAARAIGMTRGQAMRHTILPQAARIVVPPLGNQFNLMLKNTSLLAVISVSELYTAATVLQGQTFQPFEVFGAVSIYYLAMTTLWGFIQSLIEKRLRRGWASSSTATRSNFGRRLLVGTR
jgi:polar amino acid transport system permease protein